MSTQKMFGCKNNKNSVISSIINFSRGMKAVNQGLHLGVSFIQSMLQRVKIQQVIWDICYHKTQVS